MKPAFARTGGHSDTQQKEEKSQRPRHPQERVEVVANEKVLLNSAQGSYPVEASYQGRQPSRGEIKIALNSK